MRTISRAAVAAIGLMVGVMALVTGGCGCTPGMDRFNVEVALDLSLAQRPGGPPQITVDLVGLNDTQVSAWSSKRMTEYWTPNDRLRAESKSFRREMTFGPGNAGPKRLEKSDPIWDTWKSRGAMHLFALAELPAAAADQPGDADGRRRILPLDRCRWDSRTETLQFVVQASQIECLTPPKPPEQK